MIRRPELGPPTAPGRTLAGMAASKSLPAEQDPKNPGVPEELWGAMSADDRTAAAAESQGIERPGIAIDNTVAMRQSLAAYESAVPPEVRLDPRIRAESERMHALLDKVREDHKAMHDVHAARFDKLMWRVVFEHAQKQRATDLENARLQRESDQHAQNRHNTLTYVFSFVALAVAALAVVATVLVGK